MRRLKSTSFRRSRPPPEWERRFAAIVREDRSAGTEASGQAPAPEPARQADLERTEPGGWAEAWAANLQSLVAAAAPPGLPSTAFDGIGPVAAGRNGPEGGKARPIQRLRHRILNASRRKSATVAAASPAEPAARPSPPPAGATAAADRPDFPRRPAGRPIRAAWLSRSDGPLRTAAPVPVAGPAIAAALVIAASGVTAAYLTHRLGVEFEPAVLTASELAVPADAPAVTGAPVVALAPSAPPAPAVQPPAAMPPSDARPRLLDGLAPPVEPIVAVPAPAPQALRHPDAVTPPAPPVAGPPPVALLHSPGVPAPAAPVGIASATAVAAAELPPARPAPGALSLASWRIDAPGAAAVPRAPADLLVPLRPVFLVAPPPGTTTEAAPSLPFPIESLPALGFGDLTAAAVKAAGRPEDIGPGPAPPVVPATAVAAEAITADTVDAVPQDRRPSDARLGATTRERLAAAPAETAEPRPTALVAEAQRALRRHGYDAGPADGIAGPRTQAAVRAFQRRIGQRPDGMVDTALLRDLARTPPTQVTDGLPAPFGRPDPLAGLKRALADLFGLPPDGPRMGGSIASAADGRGPDRND